MAEVFRPSWLDPTDIWVPRGMKEAPVFTLPDNKIFVVVNKRTDVSSSSIIGRAGVKAVMDTSLGTSQQFNWIHSSIFNNVPGLTPPITNLTESQVRAAARTASLAKYQANELYEGNPWGWSDYTIPQYHWWYDERKKFHEENGIPYIDFGTYGAWDNYNGDPWNFQTGDGSNKAPNDPFFKNMISSVSAARAGYGYFSTRWTEGVGHIIKHYADQPDYASRYYNKAFAAERVAKAMNYTPAGIPPDKLIYLDWGKIEALSPEGGDLNNGLNYERQVGNQGKIITIGKHPQVDYEWQVGNIFCIGFCRTIGYIIFDERTRYGSDPSKVTAGYSEQTWVPNVSGTPAPSSVDGYPVEPMRWHDAGFEAAYYYSQCNRTEGQPWQYCRYQQADGSWVEPKTDGTTILEHAAANGGPYSATGRRGRPDAMYRVNGNAVDYWVFDPSRGKNSYESITLNPVPGIQKTINLQGSKLRLFRDTI
ncbi:hypothetical protein [Spirosoma sp. 48-14]|uniref:hypothetical protein n=1 Tax=Spirosoma sp. 48-14 TaxID=1895854 RepID=UPI000960DE3A|nr:hypothetical protein [Spirosoma sp. 48-14]OJW75715.1 MAG: hypothetical protein BGO59_09120 [Spirosoma sp. 48-14]